MTRPRYLKESPSQTAGPYVHIGCVPNFAGISGGYPQDPGASMVNDQTKGIRITLTGIVYDNTSTPVMDALIELWQADAEGFFPADPRGRSDPNFPGWGRCPANQTTGEWSVQTIKPGPVPALGTLQSPHILVWIVARGINLGLQTRLYFPDEDNTTDPILTRIEHQNRVPTLIAEQTRPTEYRFDVRLQGPDETIFFDV